MLGGRGSNPGEFIQPSGLEITESRRIIVSDSGNRRLQTFELQVARENVQRFGAPTDQLQGLVRGTAALREIVELSSASFQQDVQRFSGPGQTNAIVPSGMRLGRDGNIYVIDPYNARVIVFDRGYRIIRTIGGDKSVLRFPLDLAFSQGGEELFLADAHGARVVKMDLAGRVLATIGAHVTAAVPARDGAQFVNPFGVAAGRDGFVYVTDVGLHTVFKFTEEGNLVRSWGGWGTGPGQFYKPKGISQDEDGALCIVDFGNHRAQLMSADGDYLGEFGISNASVIPTRP
jgi:DNA-binding beta-propeller fold protein YncE